ncbi:MAG: hypothetical protein JO223_15140 [Hyphomicrobiales bacterium]|nr:hypothetical protein [Hyphomicrobiales bacterium]
MTDRFETERELKRIIEDSLGAERVFGTRITSYHDHADEPALSIGVSMKSAKDIPDARRQSELTQKLRGTLTERGDPRFPYVYFDALDIDKSPDDVDEFDSSPENSGRL